MLKTAAWAAPLLVALFVATVCFGQKRASRPSSHERAESGLRLAEQGRCGEALPLLGEAIGRISDEKLVKEVGLAGLHCAMTGGKPYAALPFLQKLCRKFPDDPEVLYEATHAFSDLSVLTSQELVKNAPFSYQFQELNAEAFETQGKWGQAATTYRKILQINPFLPGIHFRLARALLEEDPHPSPTTIEEAKKNLEKELTINPQNASADYVLAELSSQAKDLDSAIHYFTRATEADKGFAAAYLGLGTTLVGAKRFSDAIPPLQTYEKLAPESPTGHYELALAYAGVGRRDDANREAALQRKAAAALERLKRTVAEGVLQQQSTGHPPHVPKNPN